MGGKLLSLGRYTKGGDNAGGGENRLLLLEWMMLNGELLPSKEENKLFKVIHITCGCSLYMTGLFF